MNAKFQAEMKEMDEKFAAISEDAKRRYDRHRFIRRAIMTCWLSAFVASNIFSVLASYLESCLISKDRELPYEVFRYIRGAVMIVLPICATIYVLRRDQTKRYSYLFVRDQWDSFLAFRIENFASIVLILYPVVLIIAALIARNDEKTMSLLLGGSNVLSACLIIFAACYLFNRSTYIPKDEA